MAREAELSAGCITGDTRDDTNEFPSRPQQPAAFQPVIRGASSIEDRAEDPISSQKRRSLSESVHRAGDDVLEVLALHAVQLAERSLVALQIGVVERKSQREQVLHAP